MSRAQVDLGGGVTVTAINDATAVHRRPLEECFPGAPAAGWDAVRRAHPETVAGDGHWRLPFHVFLVRTPDATVLVDTGVGDERTLAAEMFRTSGGLPDGLAELGTGPAAIDAVVFTHLHEDHLGWAADVETGDAVFANARYLVHRPEWEAVHSGAPPDWVTQSLQPLWAHGRIDLVEPGPIADGIEVVPLPGHTPGHCGIVVSGASSGLALVGDAFNHPLQASEPDVPSIADGDRSRAAATRRAVLDRVRSGAWPLLGSAHLPGAWWRPQVP
jgi:glyoxylase-like metal-dependent hydrolase (beta-lactamase superfamily II)